MSDKVVSSIPCKANWLVSFQLQSPVEFVSALGLQSETIVSRLSKQLGGRISRCVNSYENIGASGIHIDILKKGYRASLISKAPW